MAAVVVFETNPLAIIEIGIDLVTKFSRKTQEMGGNHE
jgi:hypothetical protein